MKSIFTSLFFIFFLTNCTRSLVYSPSMNLPPQPLRKSQTQVLGGLDYLPETRPQNSKKRTAMGGDLILRYAFTNSFTLQLKGWQDFSNNFDDDRSGFSVSSIITINDSSDFRYGLIPSVAFLLSESSFEGGGGTIPFGLWYNKYKWLNFYLTLGPVFGMRDMEKENKEWGWGVLLNLGSAILIREHITLNLELSGIKQINKYDKREDYFLVPSLNVGYIF